MELDHRIDAELVLRRVFERLYRRFEPFDFDRRGLPRDYPSSINRYIRNNDILHSSGFEGVSAARYHLREISDAFTDSNYGRVASHFDELLALSEEFNLGVESLSDTVIQALDVLGIETTGPLYVAPSLEPEVPGLLLATNARLVRFLAESPSFLYKLEPRVFEELIAELLYKSGFEVELTAQTRDGGKDIIAFHNVLNIKSKYLFECKRYAIENKVSIDVVQRLYGIKHAEGANKAVVVTTSDFTRDARAFAAAHRWDLELKAYEDLLDWLRKVSAKDEYGHIWTPPPESSLF